MKKLPSIGTLMAPTSVAMAQMGVSMEIAQDLVDAIPDRVSLDPTSEHYWPHYKKLGVRLNGIKRPGDVHEFCVSEGWMMTRARNAQGQFRLDESGSGFLLEKIEGEVEPFFLQTVPKGQKTQADVDRLDAARLKRERKAEKLRKQMGAK